MSAAKHNGIKNKQNKKMIAVIILLVCFIIMPMLSNLDIIFHANHDHNHHGKNGDCTVCVHIHNIKELLGQIVAILKAASYAFINLCLSVSILYIVLSFFSFQTLVKLKIRING